MASARAIYFYLLAFVGLFSMHGCGGDGGGEEEDKELDFVPTGDADLANTMAPGATSPPAIDAKGGCEVTRENGGCPNRRCIKNQATYAQVCVWHESEGPQMRCTLDECEKKCIEGGDFSAVTDPWQANPAPAGVWAPGECINYNFDTAETDDIGATGNCKLFQDCPDGQEDKDGEDSYNPR